MHFGVLTANDDYGKMIGNCVRRRRPTQVETGRSGAVRCCCDDFFSSSGCACFCLQLQSFCRICVRAAFVLCLDDRIRGGRCKHTVCIYIQISNAYATQSYSAKNQYAISSHVCSSPTVGFCESHWRCCNRQFRRLDFRSHKNVDLLLYAVR